MNLRDLQSSVRQKIKMQDLEQQTYDVIVLGVGSMGSATCYNLSKRGLKVLGIEQFNIPHEYGSHTGQSRLIRKAYFEHPDYVPLLTRAYKNWNSIEKESDEKLFYKTGLLYFGRPDNTVIKGALLSSELYNIEFNRIDRRQLQDKYPQFNIPEDYETYIEPDAGFIAPEKAILTYTSLAINQGAHIRTSEKVLRWSTLGDSIEIKTSNKTYTCKKLIITAGAWLPQVVLESLPPLKVTRQILAWVVPKKSRDFTLEKFPCWTIADHQHDGIFYGFPSLDYGQFGPPGGLKIAHHSQGKIEHPDHVDRNLDGKEERKLTRFMNEFMPDVYSSTLSKKTCLYTYSPDEHFIIDMLPQNQNVVIAGGFSGHGFKFASVIGQILADLAIDRKSELPIDFLRLKRFKYDNK